MPTTYFALTIGPIYHTFEQAQKTRAVWAASYFFSWFIKRILTNTKTEGFDIILPYSGNIYKSKYGSGMYADRIYFRENNKGNKGALKQIIESELKILADDISDKTSHKNNVLGFLKSYLNLNIAEISITDGLSSDESVLKILNDILDNKELSNNYAFNFNENPLLDYLELEVGKDSLLAKDAFEDVKTRRFRSLPEICASSLDRLNKKSFNSIVNAGYKNSETELLDELKKSDAFKDVFKPHHKYYAVVYADGDNIGDLLKKIANKSDELLKFSELLLDFASKAEQCIVDYGGNGIYLGGEDILAFVPVACKKKDSDELQTIFSLVARLDQLFNEILGKFSTDRGVAAPTLSFGIMMAYAKHPLKESMRKAHELMLEAKTSNDKAKNTIGLRFQKHSGQYMECFIQKSENKKDSWKSVQQIAGNYTKSALHKKQDDILSGIIHRFKDDLFFATFAAAARQKRLEPYFKNFFDEDVHDQKNSFLSDVRLFSESVFKDYVDDKSCRDIIFTTLRLIHFINSDKE